MGYDDKPKKLPTRQPMWMQNNAAPASTTATPTAYATGVNYPNMKKEVVVTPPPKDSGAYMPYNFNKDTWGEIGKFGASLLADPIALGMSAYDFAKDPSLSNAAFLGLDALTPGNIGGLLKGLGEGAIITAGARKLAQQGVGRIVTNLVSTDNYSNKIAELYDLYKKEGIKPIVKSIKDDIPIYNITNIPEAEGEFPYRIMFGQQPRPISWEDIPVAEVGDKIAFKHPIVNKESPWTIPFPIRQADGTYTLDKGSATYKEITEGPLFSPRAYGKGEIPDFTVPQRKSNNTFLLGGYNIEWDPKTGTFTANDRWDFDLNKGELRQRIKNIVESYNFQKQNGKWEGKGDWNGHLDDVEDIKNMPGKVVPMSFKDKVRFAKSTFSQDIMPLALRFAMSKITDPITYKIPIGLNELPNFSRRSFDKEITNQFLTKFGRPGNYSHPIPKNYSMPPERDLEY